MLPAPGALGQLDCALLQEGFCVQILCRGKRTTAAGRVDSALRHDRWFC